MNREPFPKLTADDKRRLRIFIEGLRSVLGLSPLNGDPVRTDEQRFAVWDAWRGTR